MHKLLFSAASGAVLLLSGATAAMAAPQNADLQVQLQGPASVAISTPTTYSVSVKNNGPVTAQSVGLSVEFPLTNTSPTVKILGTVSGLDPSKCQIVANKLSCILGDIKKNKTVTITYTYTAPVSTKILQMKAIGSSTTNDNNLANNTSVRVPALTYPSRAISSATVTNSHCTGTNLTSYFECLLFPSSISSHVTTLNADTTVSFTEPGYTGTWSQNAAKTTLFFEYFENGGKIAEFNGFAINGSNCFDGLTTFFPASPYISPYRVCIQ